MRDRLNANSQPMRLHAPDPEKPWTAVPCRVWTSALDGGGYGRLNIRSRLRHKYGPKKGQRKTKIVRAHRMSLAEHRGVKPWQLNHVAHHCDNRPCIEPEHLVSWTPRKNLRDMMAKGRGKGQFGNPSRSNACAPSSPGAAPKVDAPQC